MNNPDFGDEPPRTPALDRTSLRAFLRDGVAAARRAAATVPDAVWADRAAAAPEDTPAGEAADAADESGG